MFIATHSLTGLPISSVDHMSSDRRFYRNRNAFAGDLVDWHLPPAIPVDPPRWGEMLERSCRAGLSAARQSLPAALVVWSLMALIAVLYFAVPASNFLFAALADLQVEMGILFPFFGMGLSVGILAEAMQVFLSKQKKWTQVNTTNALFNLCAFGVLGVVQNHFYSLQLYLFGSGNSFGVLFPKVLVDQFVWTVFFANPYQTILFMWKGLNFKSSAVASQMKPFKVFWGRNMLPVLVANWAFWIPMVTIIYCFPAVLQLPLVILSVTIWVLILSILTTNEETNKNS